MMIMSDWNAEEGKGLATGKAIGVVIGVAMKVWLGVAIGVSFSLSFPDDHVLLERGGRKKVGNRRGDWSSDRSGNESVVRSGNRSLFLAFLPG